MIIKSYATLRTTELGATEVEDNLLVTDAWQASVRQGQPVKFGVPGGRIEVELSGDEAAIESILPKLNLKTFRAGVNSVTKIRARNYMFKS